MSSSALRSSFLRPVLRSLSALVVSLILCGAYAVADSHARIVRLSYVDGDVQIDKADSHGFVSAYTNMPVVHQGKVWARDGMAEVEFEDGSSIRLTPDTILNFNNLSLDADGRHNSTVELTQGTAYFDIHLHAPDSFQVQVGREQIALTKAAHFRVFNNRQQSDVAVFGGQVSVASGLSSPVTVAKGETIHFDRDDSDRYDLAKGIDVENYDSWDTDRMQHDQSVSTAAIWNGGGNSSSSTYIPGYGLTWGAGSLPIAYPFGGSCWGNGFGSPFLTGYSWGFSPYNYGFYSDPYGYGCATPGSYWNNGVIFVPIQNAPFHFHPAVGPRHGPGVILGNNGFTPRVPHHGFVIDNETIQQRYSHMPSVTTQPTPTAGQVNDNVPAQGFVAGGNPSVPRVAPPVAVAPLVATPHVPTRTAIPPMRTNSMNNVGSGPRVNAPAIRPIAPAGGMAGPRMSSPSMSGGGMRMSGPSMSSGGGMRMGGGGGGTHSSGGGSHR